MKKDYSVDEMKKIMGKDMDIPECVDDGMKRAYEQLGIRTTCLLYTSDAADE